MKLKSITVGNYKNLAETTLDLSTMIALVSINNYGKTNLLEAIQFGMDFIGQSTSMRNNMMCSTDAIPLTTTLAGKDFKFAIEFEDSSLKEYRYVRYAFSFAWYNDQQTGAVITDETLEMRSNESVKYTAYLKRNSGEYRASKSKTGFRKLALAKDMLAVDILSAIENLDIVAVVDKIRNLSYRICDTLQLDQPTRTPAIEFNVKNASKRVLYSYDIPRALNQLKIDSKESYDLFIETIYDLFPEFEQVGLQVYKLENQELSMFKELLEKQETDKDLPFQIKQEIYTLMIKSKFLNQKVALEHMSTGTNRIIWLVANAIFGNFYGTNLLGVDEVETSIHPRMINSLLESLNDILVTSSMIVTSHSPYLIQYFKPEAIYIGVPNDQGVAKFRKIQAKKIKSLVNVARNLGVSVGEYIFELMAGDEDSVSVLSAYLEED